MNTERLIIRKHIETDWHDLYEYLSLPQTYLFEPGSPLSEKEVQELIQQRVGGQDFYAVELKEESKMIGHLYFHQTQPEKFLTWELGFIFNPKYQSKGYCTEASQRIIRYAFEELKAHRISAFCNPHNTPSCRVLENIGMVREGFFKEKAFFRTDDRGKPLWHDCCAYGILEGQNNS